MQEVQEKAMGRIPNYLLGRIMLVVAFFVLEFVILKSQAHAEKGLHLVGSTSDGKLWHTVRQSDGSWLSFGDILHETGVPWRSLLSRTEIADIAIQTVSNDLLLLVLIKQTPLSNCEVFGNCPEAWPIADGQLTIDK